jgi:hypothetical protein
MPTSTPSYVPSASPTPYPSAEPSESPSIVPSESPTFAPTAQSLLFPVPGFSTGSSCWSGCLDEISVPTTANYCQFFSQIANCRSAANVTNLNCVPACMNKLHCASEYCNVFSILAVTCSSGDNTDNAANFLPISDELNNLCEASVFQLGELPSTQNPPFSGNTSSLSYIEFNVSLNFACGTDLCGDARILANDTIALQGLSSVIAALIPGTSVASILTVSVNNDNVMLADSTHDLIRVYDTKPVHLLVSEALLNMVAVTRSLFSLISDIILEKSGRNSLRSAHAVAAGGVTEDVDDASAVHLTFSTNQTLDDDIDMATLVNVTSVKLTIYSCLSCSLRFNSLSTDLLSDDYFDDGSLNHTTVSTENAFTMILSILESAFSPSSTVVGDYWTSYAGPGYCSFNPASASRWCTAEYVPALANVSLFYPDGRVYAVTTNPPIYGSFGNDDDAGGSNGGNGIDNGAIIGGVVGGTAGAAALGSVIYKALQDNANTVQVPLSAIGDFDIPAEGF